MNEILTSNVDVVDKGLNMPIPQTPQKPVEKPPIENIMTLLEQSVQMKRKRKPLLEKLRLLTDKDMDLKEIEEMEKIEKEVEFLTKYCETLENQAVVIMNEHNVQNIPTLEHIEKTLPLLEDKETFPHPPPEFQK